MTRTSSQAGKVRRIATDAAFLCLALALSYLEYLIPLSALVPLPGFKLGFANIAVIAAAFVCSMPDAVAVAFAKVAVSSLLFGSPSSFIFSVGGAVMSLCAVAVGKYLLRRISGFTGISVISAVCHNVGQLISAGFVLSSLSVSWYLPILILAGVATGTVSGLILTKIMPPIVKYVSRNTEG